MPTPSPSVTQLLPRGAGATRPPWGVYEELRSQAGGPCAALRLVAAAAATVILAL
jgi:hypothetical protein